MKFKKKIIFPVIILSLFFTFLILIYKILTRNDDNNSNLSKRQNSIFDKNSDKLILENYELFKKIQQLYIKNEGDIYPFSAFTYNTFFPAEMGIYKRNLFKLSGVRQYEIHEIVNKSLIYLNTNLNINYGVENFLIGFMRVNPVSGFEYELYFSNRNNTDCCTSVKLNRPLNEIRILEADTMNNANDNKKIINFILPITTDLKNLISLAKFLTIFEEVCVKQDESFSSLTIVLAINNQTNDYKFKNLINEFIKRTNFKNIKIIAKKINYFSRGKLLQLGVESYNSNDIIFFCDLDILFNKNFLDLCRFNSIKNQRVFFPILYSYYNPSIIKRNLSSINLKLIIDQESGYFRDSGFGMACMYKYDFDQINGFNDWEFNEWGGEDLFLYRKFLNSNIEIFRSITPGLFHTYHYKQCNKNVLTKIQYRNCLSAKIFNEASYKTLGILYFNISNQT